MWLALLWQNKGIVMVAVSLVIFAGMGTVLKIQNSRLNNALLKIGEAEKQRDVAIEAHDALTKDWDRLQRILSDRELVRKKQEEENAKLYKTIKEALQNNRIWADTSLPVGVLQALQTLPESRPSRTPVNQPSTTGIRREN